MLKEPCDICLNSECSKVGSCDCSRCSKLAECPRRLRATIRITTKCTQSCNHCCFSCSPKKTDMMTISTAKQISKFLKNNKVFSVNLMGGEFFLNRSWYGILKEILGSVKFGRLVTNGDWVGHEPTKQKLIKLYEIYGSRIHISLSLDKWHHNNNVEEAVAFLDNVGIPYNVATEAQGVDDTIVPLGRALGSYGLYSSFACYCQNEKNQYSFLINELGEIFKCPFGVWNYANISEYTEGGFRTKFKEFNSSFYDIFISSCSSCIRAATNSNRIDKHVIDY